VLQLTGDHARAGKGEPGQHGPDAIRAEAPREPVRTVRRDQQQRDHNQVERSGWRQEGKGEQPERLARSAAERHPGAELMGPDRQLAAPHQLPDQRAYGQLTVEDVRREVVVRDVHHGERQQRPVRRQRPDREQHMSRYIGASSIPHGWRSIAVLLASWREGLLAPRGQ
jgi:hypothetical protein